MKSIISRLCALLLFVSLFACNNSNSKVNKIELIQGGKTYGGKVRFVSDENVTNLFPLGAIDKYSTRIASQIFEGLLKIDGSTLELLPAIAESFTVNADGDKYTFTIRKDVYFHKDDCFSDGTRLLTADDVKFALDFACSGSSLVIPDFSFIDQVKGGRDYYSNGGKSSQGVEGINVKGNVVEISLEQPFIGFENVVAKSSFKIFPKEALDRYGNNIIKHPVGTGPFCLKEWTDERLLLGRHEAYWRKDSDGNQLPYLSQIEMTYQRDKKQEILAFRNKEIDLMFEISTEEIDHLLGSLQEAKEGKNIKHKVESASVLGIEYIGFNNAVAPFDNLFVRQAIALALNHEDIIIDHLDGDGLTPDNGFVPYFSEFENATQIPVTNVEKAKELLIKAGYNAQHPFPKQTFYVTGEEGSKNYKIAQAVKEQLRNNLNIEIAVKVVTYQERVEAVKSGVALMWKAGWIGESPSPLDFLSPFLSSKGQKNDFNFVSSPFNAAIQNAWNERDVFKRRSSLLEAQNILANECPVVPLLRDNMIIMLNVRLRGVVASQLDMIDFTEVYIKEPRD